MSKENTLPQEGATKAFLLMNQPHSASFLWSENVRSFISKFLGNSLKTPQTMALKPGHQTRSETSFDMSSLAFPVLQNPLLHPGDRGLPGRSAAQDAAGVCGAAFGQGDGRPVPAGGPNEKARFLLQSSFPLPRGDLGLQENDTIW
jgi:hypothetical protein